MVYFYFYFYFRQTTSYFVLRTRSDSTSAAVSHSFTTLGNMSLRNYLLNVAEFGTSSDIP